MTIPSDIAALIKADHRHAYEPAIVDQLRRIDGDPWDVPLQACLINNEVSQTKLFELLHPHYDYKAHPYFDWNPPGPIEGRLSTLSTLPIELIPESFRPWIVDISNRMQTPPDFATVTAIVATASLIGTGCCIRPKQRDDWAVIPNLFGACIGRPSIVLKSPSMTEVLDMLTKLQAQAREIHKRELQHFEFDLQIQSAQKKQLEKDIAKAATAQRKDPAKLDALRNDFTTEDDLQEPACRLFKTNETSIQSMTVLQSQNARGLLTYRDELTGLLTRWDQRDHEDERAYFLEGWNGNGSYTDYKIGRGLTDAENICISLLGGIQPDKLRRYLHQSKNGGNDGLMQRFQLAVYPDEPKVWKLVDRHPDTDAKNRVFNILNELAYADFKQYGAEQKEFDRFPFMRFSSPAQIIFNNWLTTLQTVVLPSEENPLIAEHLGKYRSLMPSLALIFHLIDMADGATTTPSVSESAALMAVQWCTYLETHARRIYGMVTTPEREAAAVLAEKIRAGKLNDPFTAKDVYRNHWAGLPDRAAVEAACAILIDEDWLCIEAMESTNGRPPLPRYWINPALKVAA